MIQELGLGERNLFRKIGERFQAGSKEQKGDITDAVRPTI